MLNTDDQLSKTIDFLRFPLVVLVVLIHAHFSQLTINGINLLQGHNYPIYSGVSYFISQTIAGAAVPLFYFTSGYLFFKGLSSFRYCDYKMKIKKRTKSLLIPYIFWNLAIILLFWISQTFLPGLLSGSQKLISNYSLHDWLWSFWNIDKVNLVNEGGMPPINFPLWFIRDLMVVVVCSPIIFWLVKKLGIYIIVALGILWLTDNWLRISGLSTISFFFFSFGAYFSNNSKKLTDILKASLSISVIAYPVLIVIGYFCRDASWYFYLHKFNIIIGVLLIASFTTHFVEQGKLKSNRFLTESSFFIFAFHGYPLTVIYKSLFRIIPSHSDLSIVLIYLISPLIVISISLLLYKISRQFLPSFTSIITGGRIKDETLQANTQ